MSSRWFIAPFLVTFLFSVQFLFNPSESSARCCGLCNCWMQYVYGSNYCYCGGDCPSGCNRPDDISSQKLTVMQTDTREPFVRLMTGANCFRDKVTLSLLGNNREGLSYVSADFDANNLDGVVADSGK